MTITSHLKNISAYAVYWPLDIGIDIHKR